MDPIKHTKNEAHLMEKPKVENLVELGEDFLIKRTCLDSVSIEAEIPEVLYQGLNDFVGANPEWDKCRLMSSALANFLFQNGCEDRAVTECYLNDLFNR